jgi:hypothetical protein
VTLVGIQRAHHRGRHQGAKAEAVASYAELAAPVEVWAEPLPANSAREMASSGEDHRRTH